MSNDQTISESGEHIQDKFKRVIRGKPCYANAIKRILVRDIPTHAFDKINIIRNACAENLDELKLRLSMIPVCGRVKVSVDEAIAQNSDDRIVTTDHFHFIEGDEKMVIPDFFIAKLTKGQVLSFDMETAIGTGKQHTKWIACGAYLSYKESDGFVPNGDDGVVLVIERYQIDPVKLYENAVGIFKRRMKALLDEFGNNELVPILRSEILLIYELDEKNYDVAYIMPIVIEMRGTNRKGDDVREQISAEYTKKHPSADKYHFMIKGVRPHARMVAAIRTVIKNADKFF